MQGYTYMKGVVCFGIMVSVGEPAEGSLFLSIPRLNYGWLCVSRWILSEGDIKKPVMALPYDQGDKCCSVHLECCMAIDT